KNIVLLTEINGFFDASLLHNYMDVIEMNCGTAIVITTSFLDQCKKRQRKEKFRGFLYLFIWLDIKSKQMNRSAY
ncbi:hypothetical protein SJ510_14470, partial [Enterococcus faecium]